MQKEIYKKIKSSVYNICKDIGIKPKKLGKLSNGDDRLLISFENKRKNRLLVITGQDEDELAPILEIPDIIKEIPKFNLKIGIDIIPYFDISPPLEEIINKKISFSNYEDLKNVLKDYTLYSKEDIEKVILNKLKNENKLNPNLPLQKIDEVLLTNHGLLVVNSPEPLGYNTLNAICYGLGEYLPYKFYCLSDFNKKSINLFYKEPFSFERWVFYFRPLYSFFDLCDNNLPNDLKKIKNMAKKSNWLLNFHSDEGNPYILSFNAPKDLTNKIISALKADKIEVRNAETLSKRIRGTFTTREGVAELKSINSNLEGYTKKFGLIIETETDLKKGKLETMVSFKEVIKYLNNRL